MTIGAVLLFLPLIFLLWLANMADKRAQAQPPKRDIAIIGRLFLGLLWLLVLALGIGAVAMGVAYHRYADLEVMAARYRAQGLDPKMVIALMQALPRVGAGVVALALAGITLMLSPVRRLIARIIPIQPNSMVQTVALAYSVLILLNLWLIIGAGMDTVAQLTPAPAPSSGPRIINFIWIQDSALAVMAMIGVGWLSRRNLRSTLQRLGIVWPSVRQAAIGIGLGVLMAALLFPLSLLLEKAGVSVNPHIDELTQKLIGPMMSSLAGIITLGVAAALGEEMVFRGALQPRFGILLTALLFALLHNQYGVSLATLVVFILGLVLGWTRKRINTTTAMFVHATYNITLAAISLLASHWGW